MTLVEIREQFVKNSGRYDLVVDSTDWADNGADYYITSGQEYLDRKFSTKKSVGRIFDTVAIDTYYLTFQKKCRSITEVWVNNNEQRTKLEKVDMSLLKEEYDDIVSEIDTGAPLYYTPALLRGIDITDMNALATFIEYAVADGGADDYDGIIFFPPTDESYTIEIVGKFMSDTLSVDADESYWTKVHPHILVWAALRQLEVSYRNTEGVKDFTAPIIEELGDIDKDVVEEEIAEVDDMEA